MRRLLVMVLFWGVKCDPLGIEGSNLNEAEAVRFLQRNEAESSVMCNLVMQATWNYHTNTTDFNKRVMLLQQLRGSALRRKNWEEASRYKWRTFKNSFVRRLFSFTTVLGSSALPETDRREYAQLLQNMKTDYTKARICPYDPNRRPQSSSHEEVITLSGRNDKDPIDEERPCVPTLRLEPDLIRIVAESRNPEELQHIWTAWRNKAARPQRNKFLKFVELAKKAARLNGFNSTADFWQKDYESEFFEADLERIWEEVKPLYEQLHTYVRRKLVLRYGNERFSGDGTIPAHLLGNMWAQSWTNILDLTVPYPGRSFIDVTKAMRQQGYTALKIFRTAEEFFTSLGLDPMPQEFYLNSMLSKPTDRDVICHASSWDFCNGRDYRINQCTRITMNDLVTAHHEMGHVHYAMAYRNLPLLFRDGANPGFHEAIGDALGLSASTPSHLRQVGLTEGTHNSYEDDINFLFGIALDKIAFLPFGYLIDQWRWKVFRGEIPEKEMNKAWWELRIKYQGVSPPVLRSEKDFDPGAKYHVAANIPYIRYFVGHILQFQIHEELCRVSGHAGSLHKCDIYQSKAAGARLKRMMRLGKSQPWPSALSELTDGRIRALDAKPMLKYFSDLSEWLETQNREDDVGWSSTSAIASLRGITLKMSSSNFIGLIIGICAIVFIVICLSLYCHRRVTNRMAKNFQVQPTRSSVRMPANASVTKPSLKSSLTAVPKH